MKIFCLNPEGDITTELCTFHTSGKLNDSKNYGTWEKNITKQKTEGWDSLFASILHMVREHLFGWSRYNWEERGVCMSGGLGAHWPTGVQRLRSLRLYNLSASLTSLAWWLQWGACSTCWRFLSCFGRLLSSVTSWTIRATTGPNLPSSSAAEVSVSSIVSWSSAAWKKGTGICMESIQRGERKRRAFVQN